MKRIKLLIALLILPTVLLAQSFEGKIEYKMSYKNLPAEMQAMESMLPKKQTVWIKGPNSRFEQKMAQANTVVISNSEDGTSIILMELMGQKYRLDITKAEMDALIEDQTNPVVKYVAGTRVIAGYICKKAEVKMDGFDAVAIFYYTEEIPPVKIQGMEALPLKGMFMAYEISQQGMNISIEVSNIDIGAINDNKFTVPDGYTEMPAQIKAMLGIK